MEHGTGRGSLGRWVGAVLALGVLVGTPAFAEEVDASPEGNANLMSVAQQIFGSGKAPTAVGNGAGDVLKTGLGVVTTGAGSQLGAIAVPSAPVSGMVNLTVAQMNNLISALGNVALPAPAVPSAPAVDGSGKQGGAPLPGPVGGAGVPGGAGTAVDNLVTVGGKNPFGGGATGNGFPVAGNGHPGGGPGGAGGPGGGTADVASGGGPATGATGALGRGGNGRAAAPASHVPMVITHATDGAEARGAAPETGSSHAGSLPSVDAVDAVVTRAQGGYVGFVAYQAEDPRELAALKAMTDSLGARAAPARGLSTDTIVARLRSVLGDDIAADDLRALSPQARALVERFVQSRLFVGVRDVRTVTGGSAPSISISNVANGATVTVSEGRSALPSSGGASPSSPAAAAKSEPTVTRPLARVTIPALSAAGAKLAALADGRSAPGTASRKTGVTLVPETPPDGARRPSLAARLIAAIGRLAPTFASDPGPVPIGKLGATPAALAEAAAAAVPVRAEDTGPIPPWLGPLAVVLLVGAGACRLLLARFRRRRVRAPHGGRAPAAARGAAVPRPLTRPVFSKTGPVRAMASRSAPVPAAPHGARARRIA